MTTRMVGPRLLLAAAVAAAFAVGCGSLQKGAGEAMYAQQEFNSTMELLVIAQTGASMEEGSEQVGWTPASKPLVIPPCRMWWVRYEGKDMAALVREIHLKGIPGLILASEKLTDLSALRDLGDLRGLVFEGVEVDDEDMANLKHLNSLQTLGLGLSHRVADRGLVHIKGLKSLEDLDLAWTGVSDLGLAQLKELKCLRRLDLSSTAITDAGLAHLQGSIALQWLDLSFTGVTGAGMEHLRGLKVLQRIDLGHTEVTDAGLEHLRGLKALQWLNLEFTEVTDAGMEYLQGLEALQWLNLCLTGVRDAGLQRLRNLRSLKFLSAPAEASDEAKEALKKAIPGLKVVP